MITRYASGCVKLLLQVTVILIFVFSTSCTKQCKPTSTEGDGSVIIRNIGIKLCQLKCDESGQCLSVQYDAGTLTCRLLTAESTKTKTKEGYVSLAWNHPDVQTDSCSNKMCSAGQRCLKTRSGKSVCVQDGEQHYPETSPQRQVDKEETFGNSSLHEACRKGNLTRVRRILSQGSVDINSRHGDLGQTPLMVAAQEGYNRLVSFLITNGANKAQADNDGWNILHWACKGGHVGMVKYLLSLCGPGINSVGRNGMTPLMEAAFSGHKDVFVLLAKKGAIVSHVDYSGNNILHWGCRGGHVGMVKHLLSIDSLDINSRGTKGVTPLMEAAFAGHKDVFVLLVKRGAITSYTDNSANNVLHWACKGGHLGMVKHLLSLGSLDVNRRGTEGVTPLMKAAFAGHKDVFVLLVNNGAIASDTDDSGNNVLHWACKGGHLGMVKHLLSLYSLDINSRDVGHVTPLMKAAFSGTKDVFVLLVKRGAIVEEFDLWGGDVLHWGCRGGHLGMVKHLLSLGSLDINRRGHAGRTPLLEAAFSGHAEIVKYIASQKMVTINARDDIGRTAAMIANENSNSRIYKFLVSRGCPVK